MIRAGHVPTFQKSFCSVLERGPLARSFRSRSILTVPIWCPRQKFCRKKVVKNKKNDGFIIKSFSQPKIYLKLFDLNSGLNG